jgi:Gpi18-like mannosyltransferase
MARLKMFLATSLISLVPTLALWSVFFFSPEKFWNIPIPNVGMQTVISNYDGPLYIAVAKTMYDKESILSQYSFPLPHEYYAAHFPFYPLLIKLLSPISGYPWGMLLVTLFTSVFAHHYFFLLAKSFTKSDKNALILTLVFAAFPARWLIVRSVGAPEALFVGSIIASMYHYRKKQYFMAGLFGAVAQLTKSPGILLFIAYGLHSAYKLLVDYIATPNKNKKLPFGPSIVFLGLIPLSLLGLFVFYTIPFNNFFAYFNSGDNIHLYFPPFQIFNYTEPWVNTHWLEDIIFIYLFGAASVVTLYRQRQYDLLSFVLIFFGSIIFVSHRDVSRYALPIAPFAIIAFREYILKKDFLAVFAFLLVPIFIFAVVFISSNTMPISNWAPFL